MKAFLMHDDQDFDPGQLLIRREKELRNSRASDASLDLRQILPWNQEALRQDPASTSFVTPCRAATGFFSR